jgi:hypothetical protein
MTVDQRERVAPDCVVERSGSLRDSIAELLWSRTSEGTKVRFHYDH